MGPGINRESTLTAAMGYCAPAIVLFLRTEFHSHVLAQDSLTRADLSLVSLIKLVTSNPPKIQQTQEVTRSGNKILIRPPPPKDLKAST